MLTRAGTGYAGAMLRQFRRDAIMCGGRAVTGLEPRPVDASS
jgi:hypothetical protein